jgi:beta-barrel assembly-enhancing protease
MPTVYQKATASLLIAALALAPLSAQNLPDLGDESASVLSASQERKLGETAYRELRNQGVILNDPEVNAYLNQLGNRLLLANPEIKQSYEFFAVNDPAINAFAMPGGYIGVNIGLLALAQTESELASVLSHEIAHVSQHHIARALSGQARNQWVSLAALALAILLAKSQPQMSQAAVASAQALSIQSQLDYTRDHEREADRIGFSILEKSKLDVSAMATFFERLQRATRASDNAQVPSYLRSHPITYERIAEAQGRSQKGTYKQTVDNADFQYVRALVRSYMGDSRDVITAFQDNLTAQKYSDKAATQYGLAAAYVRDKQYLKAAAITDQLERDGVKHPMVAAMAAFIRFQDGQYEAALQRYAAALAQYPEHKQLYHDYPDVLLKHKEPQAAATFMEKALTRYPEDPYLYEIAARANADIGKKLQSHRYLGEAYWRSGNLKGAVEQFMIAAKAADGDFYQTSVVDSRLRIARAEFEEQRRNQSGWGR